MDERADRAEAGRTELRLGSSHRLHAQALGAVDAVLIDPGGPPGQQYLLCRARHNRYYADCRIMPRGGRDFGFSWQTAQASHPTRGFSAAMKFTELAVTELVEVSKCTSQLSFARTRAFRQAQ